MRFLRATHSWEYTKKLKLKLIIQYNSCDGKLNEILKQFLLPKGRSKKTQACRSIIHSFWGLTRFQKFTNTESDPRGKRSAMTWETCNQGHRATFMFGWRRANHLCRLVHLSWIRSRLCLVFCLLQCPHGVTGHPRANKGKYGKYWQEKNPVTNTTKKTGIYLLHHRMSRLP